MADQNFAYGVKGSPLVKFHDNGDGTFAPVVYGAGAPSETTLDNTGIRYVTTDGNDGDSGKTPWSAKATLASAVTSLGATGGRVYVGPGTWTYPSAVAFSVPGIEVVGEPGSTVFQQTATGYTGLKLNAGATYWRFRNVIFDMNSQAFTGDMMVSLLADNFLAQDCVFRCGASTTNRVPIQVRANNIAFDRCVFSNCYAEIQSSAAITNFEFSGCLFDCPNSSGIRCNLSAGAFEISNIRVLGGEFRIGQPGIQTTSATGTARKLTVVGTTVSCYAKDGASITEFLSFGNAGIQMDSRVIGVVHDNNARTDNGYFLEIYGNGWTVADCQMIGDFQSAAIRLYGGSNCLITGNHVRGNGHNGFIVRTASGETADNNVIAGNRFTQQVGTATLSMIRLEASNAASVSFNRTKVENNLLVGSGAGGALGIEMLRAGGTMDRTSIATNTVTGCTTPLPTAGAVGDTVTTIAGNVT